MTDFAIVHAPIGTTCIARAQKFEALGGPPEILRLSKDEDKEKLFSEFTPEDRIFLEMGGASDQVALLALASGSEVYSIPGFQLGDKHAVCDLLAVKKWTVADEKARGNETSDDLTARRNRVLALSACADSKDTRLVAFREDDWRNLRVKMLYRSYRQDQKAFLIAFQQLLARLRLNYMLEAADKAMGLTAPTGKRTSKAISAKESLDVLLKVFSEDERAEFLQKIGIEDISLKTSVPRERVEDLFEKLTERLMEEDTTVSTVAISMKETKKKIEQTLATMPVWKAVFEPIPGVGPLIGARLIANIGDIRRFKDAPALKAFAGYHHFEDGSRARRKTGTVSNWSPELKQAVYLWCQQTLKMKTSPWRIRLDQRRGYELWKILKDRQLQAFAQDLDVEILPEAFTKRELTSVNDVTLADLAVLSAHVDALRKQAGVKSGAEDEEEQESDAAPTAKDPKLAKLIRGVKMSGLNKAMRWLGQQFLKHIENKWKIAIGIIVVPPQPDRTYVDKGDTSTTASIALH